MIASCSAIYGQGIYCEKVSSALNVHLSFSRIRAGSSKNNAPRVSNLLAIASEAPLTAMHSPSRVVIHSDRALYKRGVNYCT